MPICSVNWEDEDNNRIVELAVEYRLDAGQLDVETVTPAAVVFVDAHTAQPTRKIKVWTAAGRRMLLKQYQNAAGADHLQQQLDAVLTEAVG